MTTLILQPKLKDLNYSLYCDADRALVFDARRVHRVGLLAPEEAWSRALQAIHQECQQGQGKGPVSRVIVAVAFGGDGFNTPVELSPDVYQSLERLVQQAPLHLPGTLQLLRCCQTKLPQVPMTLVFESAFFTRMPERERAYALPAALLDVMPGQRHGYQGIYHEAACSLASRQLRKKAAQRPYRIISICLEPIPELTAVKGRRVLMTTGGATPLEGIPGHTSCGTIDPSIVLTLSEKLGWGPEKINTALTQESGLLGLTNKASTLETIFADASAECQLAVQICQYRLLHACGAGVAALGGLDALAFSGRYAALGKRLGPYLAKNIQLALVSQNDPIPNYILRESKALSIVSQMGEMECKARAS